MSVHDAYTWAAIFWLLVVVGYDMSIDRKSGFFRTLFGMVNSAIGLSGLLVIAILWYDGKLHP